MILEVGCNEGIYSQQLLKLFNQDKLIGIDISNVLISKAKYNNPNNDNLIFLKKNFLRDKDLISIGKFDLIFIREIFNFLPIENHELLIKKLIKYNLKEKAVIIINDFSKNHYYINKFISLGKKNYKYFDLALLKNFPELKTTSINYGDYFHIKKSYIYKILQIKMILKLQKI